MSKSWSVIDCDVVIIVARLYALADRYKPARGIYRDTVRGPFQLTYIIKWSSIEQSLLWSVN